MTQSLDGSASDRQTIDDPVWIASVRRRLLAWFKRDARELPWRTDPTPYHVWVSEIMLQQTQVATVIGYYERFLEAFPTVTALAAADEQPLMRLWEGLGYYRRARMIHQAAKLIVEQHGGQFPTNYQDVLALPGIGRYTAGAILSISTDARLPILEGNTIRVFSRWTALQGDVKARATTDQLWQIAATMLPQKGSGLFNQAAMELGALVCKPVAPLCDQCPVAKYCEANRLALQGSIPGKVTRIEYEDRVEFAFLIPVEDHGGWLVCRVPAGQRWAGLWDFPRATDTRAKTARAAARDISRQLGFTPRPVQQLATIKHAVTKYRIRLEAHLTEPIAAAEIEMPRDHYDIRSAEQLVDLPLSVTGRKLVKSLHQLEL